MVIARIVGGLGNQLFQYAAGRAIAHRHGVALTLDISPLRNYPERRYQLDRFHIAARLATPSEIADVTGADRQGLRRRILSAIDGRRPYYRRSVVHEQTLFQYDPNLLRTGSHVCLEGYWQNERYFNEIAPLLHHELRVIAPPNPTVAELLERITTSESVCVHVRRGDYVSSTVAADVLGALPIAYYSRAVERIVAQCRSPVLFVFSDDPDWVEAELRFDVPTVYASRLTAGCDEVEDFRLMCACKHHVTANSSFSWWAAWLSTNPDGIVCSPANWSRNGAFDTSDLLPATWQAVGGD